MDESRRKVLAQSLGTAALILAVVPVALIPRVVEAQCQAQGDPVRFAPDYSSGRPAAFAEGYLSHVALYKDAQGATPRIMVGENFGYGTYSLSNPSRPQVVGYHNMLEQIPKKGDGQTTVARLAVAADGTRALISWTDSEHSNFLMKPQGTSFYYGGEFGDYRAGGLAVAKRPDGRYLGFMASAATHGLKAADVTTFATDNGVYPWDKNRPNPAITPGSIPSELVPGTDGWTSGSGLVVAGDFLFVSSGADEITVFDYVAPVLGPSGQITSNFRPIVLTAADFGGQSGAQIGAVAGAPDPSNPKRLTLLVALTSNGNIQGFGMAVVDGSSPSAPVVNPAGRLPIFAPPPPFSGSLSSVVSAAAAAQTTGGLVFLFWAADLTTDTQRLYAAQPSTWPNVSVVKDVVLRSFDGFSSPKTMVAHAVGNTVYAYSAGGLRAHVVTVSCAQSQSPASSSLQVLRTTASGGTEAVTDGGTSPAVFLGDTLTVKPAVSPIPVAGSSSALADWRIDLDHHTSERAGSFPRLATPDLSAASQGALPSAITLVGPCDPRNGSPNITTGVGCWTSVVGNGSTGGPDFTSVTIPRQQEGQVKSLTLAFEAANQLGSDGLATFNVNWTVPRVKLKNDRIVLGTAVVDASEGVPASQGYKWYFARSPGVPPSEANPLEYYPDCTGAFCTPRITGKGAFHYWVTVPYKNGYQSEDCGSPCVQSRGTVTVTDVSLSFTVPSQATKSQGRVTVTNGSTVSGSVTPCPGYQYDLCDATTGPCQSSGYPGSIAFSGGTGDVALPQATGYPRTYWLRIKYRFAYDSGCTNPVDEQWLPASPVQGDPTATAISVTDVSYNPQIRIFVGGVDPCAGGGGGPGGGGSCEGFAAKVNESLTAWAYDANSSSPIPSSAGTFSWSFGSSASPSPTTGSGNGVGFSYRSTGTPTVTLTFTPTGGSPVVKTTNGQVTTTVTPVSASASANPSTVSTGQSVTFTASASGGTPGYTYTWTFSDGGTGSGQSIAHAFTTAGSHYGTVTVRDAASSQATAAAYVTVQTTTPTYNLELKVFVNGVDPCVTSGGGGPGGGPGGGLLACSFTVKSNDDQLTAYAYNNGSYLQGGTFQWTFGGPAASPSTGSYNQFPFKYTAAGTATVGLTWTPTGGSAVIAPSISFTVLAGGPPPLSVAVVASPTSAYTGTAITFTATATGGSGTFTEYSWAFGDGQGGVGNPVQHSFAVAGTYTASCAVRDSTGSLASKAVSVVITAPPQAPMWLVPGVAWADGQNGAVWQSDLSMFNPDPLNPMRLRMAFLDGSITDLKNVAWSGWVRLQPRETRTYANVLQGAFSLPRGRAGAILVQHEELSPTYLPVMNARTYDAGRGDGGTVGLSLQVVSLQSTGSTPGGGGPGGSLWAGVGPEAVGGTYEVIGLSDDATSYTNFAIANLQGDTVRAELKFETFENGTRVSLGNPLLVDLAPYGIRNFTNVLTEAAGYVGKPVHAYRATVRLLQGTAVLPYASVIDRNSKAPALLTPPHSASRSYRIPGVVRAQGQNGSVWRSDVTIYNPADRDRVLKITYTYRKSTDPTRLQSHTLYFQMYARELVEADDFVKFWLELDESDTNNYFDSVVDVAPYDGSTEPLYVTGRTYNNQPTGNVALGVPGFTAADGISRTSAQRKLVFAGLRSDDSYRSNVALMLASPDETVPASVGATAKVYDVDGNLLTTRSFGLSSLTPFQQFSVDELVQNFAPAARKSMSIIVEDVEGAGLFTGYATVIDRKSGGATLSPGQSAP